MLSVLCRVSRVMYFYAEGHYAQCLYAEYRCAECSGVVYLIFVMTSSDQLLFKLKLYYFFAKRPILMWRSTVLRLPFHQGFKG